MIQILILASVLLGGLAQSLPPCNSTDYKYTFSECIEEKRDLIFYFPQDICENSAGQALPSNIKHLSCQKECDKGEYLGYDDALHVQSCMKCPANTYSLGGGMRIDGALKEWAQEDIFKKWKEGGCAKAEYRFSDYQLIHSCEGWASSSDGKYFESMLPEHKEDKMYYDLWFKLGVRTVKPGSVRCGQQQVRFEFKKDTETELLGIFNNGVLSFIINDVVEAQYESQKHSTSDSNWQKAEFYLQPGFHDLMWLYRFHYKDNKELKAQIRVSSTIISQKIEVDGIEYAHTYCKPCLYGQSDEGSYSCSTCTENQYLSTDTEKCEPCPDGKLSIPGASGLSSCKDAPDCTEHDYEKTVQACSNGQRSVTYKWVESGGRPVCRQNAVLLPHNGDSVQEECPPCQPGNFLSVANNIQTCERCGLGTYISEHHRNETECNTCPRDQIALRALEFDQFFNPLYPELSVNCISTDLDTVSDDCLHLRGFAVQNGTLTTGSPIPAGVVLSVMTTNTLDFQRNLTSREIVTHYSYSGESRYDMKFELLIDGAVSGQFPLGNGETHLVLSHFMDHGQHQLSWRFTSASIQTDFEVKIHAIKIQGITEGGGVSCDDCPVGHYVSPDQSECYACPAGFQPTPSKDNCEICPQDQFNPFQGSECRACPEMTFSSDDRLKCEIKEYVDHQRSDLHRYVLQFFSEEKLTLLNCGNKNATHNCFYPGILGPVLTEQGNYYDKSFFLSGFSHGQFDKHPSLINIPSGDGAISGLPAYVYGVFLEEGAMSVEETQTLKLQKHNLGSVITETNFLELNDFEPPVLIFRLAFGDYCDPSLLKHTRQNSSAQEFLRYSSEIRLECDRTVESKVVYNPQQQSGCKFGFTWYSKYACARCRADQMNALLGACSWGSRTITYEVKNDEKCSVFPLVGQQEERPQLIYEWYLFNEPCSDSRDFVKSQMFYVVMVLAVLTILSFTCMMIILCKKYRKIKHNYNRLLQNPGRSSDMQMPHSQEGGADPGQIELSNL